MNLDAWPEIDLRHVYEPDSSGRYCVMCMRAPNHPQHISEEFRAKLHAAYERLVVKS